MLQGDLAIIKVPKLQTDKDLKPLVLPEPPYYPNGKIKYISAEHFLLKRKTSPFYFNFQLISMIVHWRGGLGNIFFLIVMVWANPIIFTRIFSHWHQWGLPYSTLYTNTKVINLGSDTFGNPNFQKVLQNYPSSPIISIPRCIAYLCYLVKNQAWF